MELIIKISDIVNWLTVNTLRRLHFLPELKLHFFMVAIGLVFDNRRAGKIPEIKLMSKLKPTKAK
jgi:hypothetical protein